jgi:polysaccharide export outer membrane protein
MNTLGKIIFMGVVTLAAPLSAQAQSAGPAGAEAPNYVIGPGDTLHIFVWKNPELSAEVPVRPDGKITTPLAPDIQAQGRTPTQLAADLKAALGNYVQDPVVTVVVRTFAAPDNSAAIRVIGAAGVPKTIPYREGLTALDVVIAVGGLDMFANGNGAELLRKENGVYKPYPLHLADLVRKGDLDANVEMRPGDVIRIPERMF